MRRVLKSHPAKERADQPLPLLASTTPSPRSLSLFKPGDTTALKHVSSVGKTRLKCIEKFQIQWAKLHANASSLHSFLPVCRPTEPLKKTSDFQKKREEEEEAKQNENVQTERKALSRSWPFQQSRPLFNNGPITCQGPQHLCVCVCWSENNTLRVCDGYSSRNDKMLVGMYKHM